MGLSHPKHPLHGVQFHPESFMTEHGFALVDNFLRLGPLASWVDRGRRSAAPAATHRFVMGRAA